MQTILTDVRGVCLSVCLSVCHAAAARAVYAGSFGADFVKLLLPLVGLGLAQI